MHSNWTYLCDLYYEYDKQQTQDWKICMIGKGETGNFWSKPVYFFDADERVAWKYQQRYLLNNEIALEYDPPSKDYETCKIYFDSIIDALVSDGVLFVAYGTEEYRSVRIETFWKNLSLKGADERKKLRLQLIQRYGCDTQMSSDTSRVTFDKHFKTGKDIKVIYNNSGINNLSKLYALIGIL